MEFQVKVERKSAWSRLKGFMTGGTTLETVAVDTPYRSTSRESRASQEWYASSADADEALLPALATLRNQSRDLDRNESLARGAIENHTTNVIGAGLRPQARIDHELIGIPQDKAREFERRAEKIFELHMQKNTADFHGVVSFQELQAQVFRAALLDGDCMVVRRYRDRPLAILPTCLQVIDGARLQNPLIVKSPRTDIREGVELDSTGMPVAYHIAKADQRFLLGSDTVRAARFDQEGAPAILHVFMQRLPGQSRGEPLLAPVVEKFKQISRYTEAEIMAAVISAFYATFITSETGGIIGRQNQALPESMRPEPERRTVKFGPGMLVPLLPGEKISSPAPGRPNSNFEAFFDAIASQIGIGVGLPPEVLAQKFQSSYSAARAALLEAWKAFKIRRVWFVTGLCQPVWEWVITDAIREGMLDAPGFNDPLKRQAYLQTQWTGTEMESIDPLKDARANEVEVNAGLRTRRSIVESQGRDFDKHIREYKAERSTFEKSDLS
ncbi:MAG TPA: phage portal protein [Oligoflexus sp.]|uniref:phage portal protein n=1 Tax=Oligoflexus sp. TaxID=1971216 RepID=UPI002D3B9488|nr:phage portal protein [Oligoflexus sp.]HYX35784.1 phage portal protein [Oligoflexus sp.]